MTSLTGRQEEFLCKFLDLYRDTDGTLHYSQVAEYLGVSKITAYDMLKLLERRGMVRAEYVVPERNRGPGRSTITFHPTAKALALLDELSGDEWDAAEWAQVKTHILESLHSSKFSDYREMLSEITARIPEQNNPMLYMAEMVTALILILNTAMGSNTTVSLEERLDQLGLPGELGLSALAGLSLGLSYVEQVNHHFTKSLISHTRRYQNILAGLNKENLRRLSELAADVVHQIEMSSNSASSF